MGEGLLNPRIHSSMQKVCFVVETDQEIRTTIEVAVLQRRPTIMANSVTTVYVDWIVNCFMSLLLSDIILSAIYGFVN